MPHLEFTSQLSRHVDCPADQVDAATLSEAFEIFFAQHPEVRGYVLDDQGAVRQHVAVFIDGKLLGQRDQLAIPLRPESEVFVMQALSGG